MSASIILPSRILYSAWWRNLEQKGLSQILCQHSVLFFSSAKHRKLNKARESGALHCSNCEVLLKEPSAKPHSNKQPERATRGQGI